MTIRCFARFAVSCAGLALAMPAAGAQEALPAGVTANVPTRVAELRDAALNDTVAYDIVEGLTTEIGPRLAGTDAEARARDWAVTKLKSLGFRNVHIETYQMPVWMRGEEKAEVIAPFSQPLRITALGNSGATPQKGITAPIVYFETFGDLTRAPTASLKGKIAFVSNQMVPTQDASGYGTFGMARFVGPQIAAEKGAAAILIRSIGTDESRAPHAGNTNFRDGTTPIPAAALSVEDAANLERMVERGKPVTLHLLLTPKQIGLQESGNVIADVPGSDPDAGIVLIGGHLDSWDLGTGAIDDASGLGITTAAAHRIMQAGTPRRTIRVVWFGSEEVGAFGGEAYAKAHKDERHVLAAESDLGADAIWRFETNLPASAAPIGDRLQAALAPLGIARGPGKAHDGADIGPVLRQGTAAIDLNQSALRYFDWHHTAEDVLERIDPEQLRQNVAAWTAMLAIVADAPEAIGTVDS